MTERTVESVSRVIGTLIIMFATYLLGYSTIVWVVDGQTPVELTVAAIGLTGFSVIFVRGVRDAVGLGLGSNRRPLELLIGAVCTLILTVWLSGYLVTTAAVFGGLLALSLPVRRALLWTAPTIGLIAISGAVHAEPLPSVLNSMVKAVVMVVTFYAMGWVNQLYGEVHQARVKLTRMAIVEERLRFSRDLHDVLGHNLSLITLKGELAMRFVDGGRMEHAREEMLAVTQLSRHSITEVRQVVRGYRSPNVTAVIEGVQSALTAAGVTVTANDVPQGLPEEVHEVLGWVVREGSTNILRHSKATCCSIQTWTDDQNVRLRMTNDGVTPRDKRMSSRGSGIAGLRERLETVGGSLTHTPGPDLTYQIEVRIPLGMTKDTQ